MLAKFYGVHPGEFLREPVSAVQQHISRTADMLAEMKTGEDDG